MTAPKRNILATSALPYANGRIHLGHIVEHVQSDIWTRAMRMAGHTVHFVCADDAHGSGIMLRAESEGITPQALIARVWNEHTADLRDFAIEYDHYSTTDSEANRELTARIWNALKAGGHTESRPVKQLFDPQKEMFLPDRFIKGECPNCHSLDQYGDACEVCGKTYNPTDLINPYSVVSGATPVEKESNHLFVKLADFEEMLKAWLIERRDAGGLQSEVVNKLQEWFADGLRSWDVSRDAPYFGFGIPDEPGKFFYVWVDAPVGYLAAFKELCESGRTPDLGPADFERYTRAGADDTEMVHFIGKDIVYFHTLFWPAMLHGSGLRTPSAVNVHGFLTVDGAKMSKSRGTFVNARTYLDHLDPDYLRYYLSTLLGPTLADLDLDLKSFEERVNSHLVGKWVNIASRCAGFIEKLFDGKLCDSLDEEEGTALGDRYDLTVSQLLRPCVRLFEQRDYAAVTRLLVQSADVANDFIATQKPWQLAKDETRRDDLHRVCTLAINIFRATACYLKPIIPATVKRAEDFLGIEFNHFSDVDEPLLGTSIRPFTALQSRIDATKITAMIDASKESLQPAAVVGAASAAKGASAQSDGGKGTSIAAEAAPTKAGAPDGLAALVSIDDFAKLDLRIGKVLACEFVEGSEKLLRFELDAGDLGRRQIFSGIRAAYGTPEKLVGRNVVFIANLAPRKMRFGVSEGMILSAGSGGADLFLLDADPGAAAGASVKYRRAPAANRQLLQPISTLPAVSSESSEEGGIVMDVWIRVAAALLAALASTAASAFEVEVTDPGSTLAVAPGGYSDVPFAIHNLTDTPVTNVSMGITYYGASGGFSFEQQSLPQCSALAAVPEVPDAQQFTVTSIPAHGVVTCILRVHRALSQIDNETVSWYLAAPYAYTGFFSAGTFTNIAMDAERVQSTVGADDIVHTLFRIFANNLGDTDAENVRVSLGPTCVGSGVTVDMDFPGGCSFTAIECGFLGGPGPGERLSVAAHSTQSCLVRFSAARASHAIVTGYLQSGFNNPADGGLIDDDNFSDDRLTLDINGSGQEVAFPAPSLSRGMLVLLALLLAAGAAAGHALLRQPRRARRDS